MPKLFTAIATRLALLCASLIVAVMLVEIIVRIVASENTGIHIQDPYIGKRMKPNMDQAMSSIGCWKSHVRTNSRGFMGDEYTDAKPAGVARFAHVGDSLLEGIHVDTDNTITEQLERLMPNSEHLNFGLGGQGTYPEYLTYQHYIRPLDADAVVVWFYGGNDFRDNYLARTTIAGNAALEPTAKPASNPLRTFLLEKMASPRFFYKRIGRSPLVNTWLQKMGLLNTEQDSTTADMLPLQFRTSYVDTQERALAAQATKEALALLQKAVSSEQVLVVLLPSLPVVHPESKAELMQKYPQLASETLDTDFAARSLTRITDELGLPLLDLTPDFAAAYQNGTEPHLLCDGHLSLEGHTLAADKFTSWYNILSL